MMRCVYSGGKGPSCYVHEGLQGGVHPPCRLTNSCLHGLELLVAASPTSSGHTARHERPTTTYLPCLCCTVAAPCRTSRPSMIWKRTAKWKWISTENPTSMETTSTARHTVAEWCIKCSCLCVQGVSLE
jgi:hypothetical protein